MKGKVIKDFLDMLCAIDDGEYMAQDFKISKKGRNLGIKLATPYPLKRCELENYDSPIPEYI